MLKRPIMPDFATIGIVDGIMDLILWRPPPIPHHSIVTCVRSLAHNAHCYDCRNMAKPPGFPWALKKAMFLDKDLWAEMCLFHPVDWEGRTHHGCSVWMAWLSLRLSSLCFLKAHRRSFARLQTLS